MHAPPDSATSETLTLSSADYARSKMELAELRAARDRETADDPAALDGLIHQLSDLLRVCVVSDDLEPRIGSVLHVEDLDSGKRGRYELVAVLDAANRAAMSLSSPVGAALAALPVGESIEVRLDSGRSRRLRLLDVEAGPGGHNGSR